MTQAKTPFEKAGYTKDSKFKVTSSYGDFEEGNVVILRKDDGTHSPQFVLVDDPDVWEFMDLDDEVELIVEDKPKHTNYPNPPHKHAELIKQWADGAEIEYFSICDCWLKADNPPIWAENLQYRVKPQKSEKDIQIEKLEAEYKNVLEEYTKTYNNMVGTLLPQINDIVTKLQELKSNVQ